MPIQARAAAQYRELGTGGTDRLVKWLAELSGKMPNFAPTLDAVPALSQFEPLVDLAGIARRWLDQGEVAGQVAKWLLPLTLALLPLAGAAQVPLGPGLLTVLLEAERAILATLEQATGHLPIESQARAISERLRDWLRAAIANLVGVGGVRVRAAPATLVSGRFAEFAVEIENEGSLPLRSLSIGTTPDWGSAQTHYLAERGAITLNLHGDVPKQGSQLNLQLKWTARNLANQTVGCKIACNNDPLKGCFRVQ
jgi:type I restriction enzyme M protein